MILTGAHGVIASSIAAGIPQDYIAYWDMANDALDEVGTYDITLNNGAVQNSDHVDYDGSNDYGQCTRLAINDNAFTLVVRVRFDAITSSGEYIANSRSSGTESSSQTEWQLVCNPTSNVFRFRVFTDGTDYSCSGSVPSTATWYTVAARFDGGNTIAELFVDDPVTADATDSGGSGDMGTAASNTQFAKRGWETASSTSCGNIDQSRTIVYDYAVSDVELSAIMSFIDTGS